VILSVILVLPGGHCPPGEKRKTNARDRVLLVIGRDDAELSETIRQSKKSKKDNKKK
jgi:hypothetical protein